MFFLVNCLKYVYISIGTVIVITGTYGIIMIACRIKYKKAYNEMATHNYLQELKVINIEVNINSVCNLGCIKFILTILNDAKLI